jgi:uncharacterized protein involved in type VI secretion and phage assembly
MRKINGVATGIVKSLKDPDGEARIQVQFPWLDKDYRSSWAPIAFPMAGKSRGMYFMPEEGDEVLVAFEQGDMDHPYIVGFLWNGVDKPPDDEINFSVRRLRTVSGHVIEFNDDKNQILIKTKGKQEILMEDDPAKITISTSNEVKVELNDSPASVKIGTKPGNTVEINDTPGNIKLATVSGTQLEIGPSGITLSASAGTLTINCLQATVTATTLLSVTAPITTFSGVVQATTLIAQAVVGSAYSPAPGNTFGL